MDEGKSRAITTGKGLQRETGREKRKINIDRAGSDNTDV